MGRFGVLFVLEEIYHSRPLCIVQREAFLLWIGVFGDDEILCDKMLVCSCCSDIP
jgi:hypothetical protein